ncbi:beta-ketoacyl-ACP synthase II [Mangrovibacterium lignilyticum]|uniref:beta-ketoacyl-ACP synthase II n=1 Tax=Mangrovibacterium lignilyticum TaxID=2668052 RepID=UPI001EE5A3C4|nr:beta-ketoacyl-ACP synthase II [Mangrovibacterium lignilyticum]
MKRAVITGIGAITPIGNSVSEFWDNLVNGKSGAAFITKFNPENYNTKFACEVKNFNPLAVATRQEAKKMDLFTLYALAAAKECIQDSGIDLEQCDRNKVGVIIASGIGGMKSFEDEILNFAEIRDKPRFSPFFVTRMITNMASGQISIKYGLRGPSYSLTSACSSANNAIANALDLIRLGRATIILAGGAEATITEASIGGFNAIKALSTRNESPETASRPFDQSRDGFVSGEGSGVLMVEELEHALKRGAKIYCELAGYGTASDAYHVVATHPDGLGAKISMEEALTDAGLTPSDVDYINAHATSTPLGDISETKAISEVFNQALDKIQISATKSMTGHLLGAAGAIEAIACIKAIENNIIPPTINLNEVDEAIDPRLKLTPNKAVQKEVRVALNNTFGFGGHCLTSIFKEFER